MPIGQAAAIWILTFLIGLTGGELLRQEALDAESVAATRGPTEPSAPTSALAVNATVRIATSMATTTTSPPQTTTTVDCVRDEPCPDHPGQEASQNKHGKGQGHGEGGKKRGHGKDGKPGSG
jgi:hypothetical protein